MKTIKHTEVFDTAPANLYNWFMDSEMHSKFTGSKAIIGQKVGDTFRAWDGYIEGANKILVPGKLIVQTWRANDWEKDVFSEATFKFSPQGTNKTLLEFTQTGVPDSQCESIKQGWVEYYWQPLKKIL